MSITILQIWSIVKLKEAFETEGYETKPLGRGAFKNIPFEDGGGWRVNYGGDGLIQYHPKERSHHVEAYYKISTGKGKHWYNLNGEEIDPKSGQHS